MSTNQQSIFLADLTHTNYVIASNVMPLGIGLLASYAQSIRPDLKFELFKYPADLSSRLESVNPPLVAFANYSWNLELSYAFALRIKKNSPKTVIVFGGPNYGLTKPEIEEFWQRYPKIDFYVVLEGEVAFTNLLSQLIKANFNIESAQARSEELLNVHFLAGTSVVQSPMADRIVSLDEIPSPYITGLMDKFFDDKLIPLTHSTRGCPFTCTFCTEGSKYYQKVAQRTNLEMELRYIAGMIGSVPDLALSDANFGMFAQDMEKAKIIRRIQDEFGWPNRLIVSTGKNQKERIIEVAALLQGSLSVAASLQSTDPEVLGNINRSNISIEALRQVVTGSQGSDSNTYTEIILNLPGDSLEKHEQSLRDVTNLGLGIVRMYQLILLPQTALNTPESRSRFGIQTKFRINPRSFGKYELYGDQFIVTEMEEIAIASNTMSFDDYLKCRDLDLAVELIHNTGLFYELAALFRYFDLGWFDLVKAFTEQAKSGETAHLYRLFSEYREDNLAGIHSTRADVADEVEKNFERYLADLEGTNEIAKAKAKGVSLYFNEIHEVVFKLAVQIVEASSITGVKKISDYLIELKKYSLMRKVNFLDTSVVSVLDSYFDFRMLEESGFDVDPQSHMSSKSKRIVLRHSPEQIRAISGYTKQYDANTIDGLGRILMRVNPRLLFRKIINVDESQEVVSAKDDLENALTTASVNAYGGFTVD